MSNRADWSTLRLHSLILFADADSNSDSRYFGQIRANSLIPPPYSSHRPQTRLWKLPYSAKLAVLITSLWLTCDPSGILFSERVSAETSVRGATIL